MIISRKKNENAEIVIQSLEKLDLNDLADIIRASIESNPYDDAIATLAVEMMTFSEKKHIRKVKTLLGRAKANNLPDIANLLKYPERQLDLQMIQDLSELHFIKAHENLLLFGSSGTGKTWLAKALLNLACQRHIRSRWISFPVLYRELENLYRGNAKDQNAMDKRLKYYSGIPLLCIDEFPNCKMKNEYLIQEFFDVRCSYSNSTIVCSQASPEKWPELFEIRSFGESIRGRLQENAVVMEMKGPDLRLFKPDAE